MAQVTYKNRKQELGIFYTPEIVVSFIFDILNILKEKEDRESQRWDRRKPTPHYPSVIDPAVGEGVFLKGAVESGLTRPQYVFGVDIDEHVVEQWERINLLKSFGSRANLENHFFHQNGLMPLDENRVLPYKKGGLREFDAVVGNPPYGGVGLSETELTDDLIARLSEFEILRKKGGNNNAGKQATLGDIQNPLAAQKLRSFPIEVLFVERFIQLAKPGGWIALIIPEGILANSNLHYVREFIAERTNVLAIVSLPREAFKQVGTNAKTSILLLQKYRGEEKKHLDYPVFLASIGKLEEGPFGELANSFEGFHNGKTRR